jgi:hypothetical protein
MVAVGRNGTLELYPDKVRICRSGALAFMSGLRGEKDIPLSALGSVQLKAASLMVNGYVQFAYAGGKEAPKGPLNASTDENSIVFKGSQQPAFEAIRDAIDERLTEARNPAPSHFSPADEIRKLAALRDDGILTAEEFERKKRQLLNL